MNRRALATVLAVSLVTASAAPASAQGTRPKAPSNTARPAAGATTGPRPLAESLTGDAKEAYDSAKLLYGAGDYAGASLKYKVAYDASHDPRLLWNMAAAEKSLRRYAKALPLVRQYLIDGDAILSPEDKAEARELIDVMEPLTAKLAIAVSEPGAEVSIDDEPQGQSPLRSVLVEIGTRKIRVRKPGFEDIAKDVVVAGAGEVTVEMKLVKILHEGRLVVKTAPDATITLDDHVVGTGLFSGVVASGGHTLGVSAPRMVTYHSEVVVQDNQVREVGVSLEREPSKGIPTWVLITGGVVIASGIGLGAYLIAKGSGDNGTVPPYNGPTGTLGSVQASHPIRFGF